MTLLLPACCRPHRSAAPIFVSDAVRGLDPTGTRPISSRFSQDAAVRLRRVKQELRGMVIDADALSLKRPSADSPGDRVSALMDWLRKAEDRIVFDGTSDAEATAQAVSRSWIRRHVVDAYKKGMDDAARLVKRAGGDRPNVAMLDQEHARAAVTAVHRVYGELVGATDAMDQRVGRLIGGVVTRDGASPTLVARVALQPFETVGVVRARTIGRSEIVRTYNDASLDVYRRAGIRHVRGKAERIRRALVHDARRHRSSSSDLDVVAFQTAGDDLVCPDCASLDGTVVSVEEAYGIIPVHPDCRCAWVPAGDWSGGGLE